MLHQQLLRLSFRHTTNSIAGRLYSKCSVAATNASEPPFIYCSSPIVESWNGWGFMNPETTAVLATKRKRSAATPTFISLTTPQSVKRYKTKNLYLMENLKLDSSQKDRKDLQVTDDRADIGQLSYVLFKLREEVSMTRN